VIASIALLVSLTGTSVAAVSQLVPRNSVGTVQLKKNAVTSAKVKNRSLLRADFRPGQVPAGPQGPAGPAGAAGAAGPAGPAGTGATLAFRTVTSPNATTTASATFADLPGASTSIEIPSGATATLFLSFSAESLCTGGAIAGYCPVRILVDGNESAPVVGTDFAFDSSDSNAEGGASWESHAIERSIAGIAAGAHTVTVQYAAVNGATLRLDDWALNVVAMRQS
jgi:hypothetical protein